MVFCLFKQEEKMEKKLFIILSCYVVLLCLPNDLMAGDEKSDVYVLEDIVVTGELIRPTKQTGDSLYTGTSVTKKESSCWALLPKQVFIMHWIFFQALMWKVMTRTG